MTKSASGKIFSKPANLVKEIRLPFQIEVSDTLATNSWEILTNLTLTNSPQIWTDPQATNAPHRFYRTSLVP